MPATDTALPRYRGAACRPYDSRLFSVDPDTLSPGDGETVLVRSWAARAREICSTCPVRVRCLQDAARDKTPGIRGGYTPAERAEPFLVELLGNGRDR